MVTLACAVVAYLRSLFLPRHKLALEARIHGELLQLGFEISEPTVSRYLHNLNGRRDESRAKRWLAFSTTTAR